VAVQRHDGTTALPLAKTPPQAIERDLRMVGQPATLGADRVRAAARTTSVP
jgi:hypothetical protein